MTRRWWTEERLAWLRENAKDRPNRELAAMATEEFGVEVTASQVRAAKANHGVRSNARPGIPAGYSTKYPDGFLEYVKANAKGRTTAELLTMCEDEFGEGVIDHDRLHCFKRNHKIRSGVDARFKKGQEAHNKGKRISPETYAKCAPTMFKPGNMPWNGRIPIGAERATKDGYVMVKVAARKSPRNGGRNNDNWRMKHVMAWEEANGRKVPDGHCVIFLDGDKANCDPSNLMAVPRGTMAAMTHRGERSDEPGVTKAYAAIETLAQAAREKERGRRDDGDE